MISGNYKFAALAVAVFAITGFSLTVNAQGTTGSIRGTVTDPIAAPIAAATISLTSETNSPGFRKTATADARGFFSFSEIPVGSYKIKIESHQFRTFVGQLTVYVDATICSGMCFQMRRIYSRNS